MNDETLILYYYDDGLTREERQQVANLLTTDPDVTARYRAVSQELELLSSPATTVPPADMVERWHDSIRRAARAEIVAFKKPVLHTWSFIWGAAITATLVVGIGIGIFVSGSMAPEAVPPNALVNNSPNSGAFIRGLQVHLRESEQSLTSIPFTETADRTRLIMSIIDQNRLLESVAKQNGSPGLARVLRAFELVLARLAADDITPQEAEALQTKLLFELNVVLTKLAHDTSDESRTI